MKRVLNRLLIVDDEAGIRDYLSIVASELGFVVCACANAEEFHAALNSFEPSLIILDLNLPGNDGIELIRFLTLEQSDAQVLLISGEDRRVLNSAERLGASQGLHMAGALQKPISLPELESVLNHVMHEEVNESDLAAAIEAGDLLVHYQPQLQSNAKGEWSISGGEALVRWRHPRFGILMPASFVPMAEETDLIGSLTDFVLRETLQQYTQWFEHGLDMNLSVNIAPQLLTDVEFPDRLSVLLRENCVEGSRLTLEITETAAATDLDAMMDILTRLRLKGIGLSIDDFGTGYSSMKQLFCMPFTELKIDRSFVAEIPGSSDARTMVTTMINLAHNLNMIACAEGVESREVLDFLELAGCPSVQGFFICKPVSASEFEDFVQTWNKLEIQQRFSNSNSRSAEACSSRIDLPAGKRDSSESDYGDTVSESNKPMSGSCT